MIDGSKERKLQLALNFTILVKAAVIYGQEVWWPGISSPMVIPGR